MSKQVQLEKRYIDWARKRRIILLCGMLSIFLTYFYEIGSQRFFCMLNSYSQISVSLTRFVPEFYGSVFYGVWFFFVFVAFWWVFFPPLFFFTAFHLYTNSTERETDEILSVRYEDGRWSKPYYDCGGANIWMLTYTVPFFGYENGSYFFK